MSFFSSNQERKLWFYALLILVAIYGSLGFAGALVRFFQDRNLLTPIFILGLLMVIITVLSHGLKTRPRGMEMVTGLGIFSASLLLFARISVPEDAHGHLIEYSLVALFIYEALLERKSQGRKVAVPAILAILISTLLGVLDEGIQALLPNRVFDPLDLLFDVLAVVFAICTSMVLTWVRQWFAKTPEDLNA